MNKDEIDKLSSQDGISFIRIDNRATTQLGRMLDSQYIIPFTYPGLGQFNTTEGFWYYISNDKPVELLKVLNGCDCRRYIKELKLSGEYKKVHINNFYQHILYANYLKIEENKRLKQLLLECNLPFMMYFVTESNGKYHINKTNSSHPRLSNLTSLRRMYQSCDGNLKLEIPDISEILRIHQNNM